MDMQQCSWLRHYATGQKVADSIPEEVIGFCLLFQPFQPHRGPGSTSKKWVQGTFLFGGGGRGLACKTENTTICELTVQYMWHARCNFHHLGLNTHNATQGETRWGSLGPHSERVKDNQMKNFDSLMQCLPFKCFSSIAHSWRSGQRWRYTGPSVTKKLDILHRWAPQILPSCFSRTVK
jgi:hypothetical protein